eukprot:TRINITY_DN3393_c0_g1_i1.p2 TRINITY_DN3393_c0_g1~~TRINITY_DN3393_c0_g1_i1.p2  ORF type:complete len:224 (-),score=37.00 TRINITY_DN3393_c0_g1_i1:252-923(-)
MAAPSTNGLALPKRRLLNLGGVPHPDGMIAEALPEWLLTSPALARLRDAGVFPAGMEPNQVLLNEYTAGQGIDPHCDGPLFEPCVAILSLGSSALLHFLEPPESIDGVAGTRRRGWAELGPAAATVLLQPGSLLVFSDDAYQRLWHGVPDVLEELVDGRCLNREQLGVPLGSRIERGQRLSLTIRAVRRVAVPAGEFLTESQAEEAKRRRCWWARSISERVSN